MAVSKEKKQETIAELKEMIGNSKAMVFADYRGLTAGQLSNLRGRLRPLNAKFTVAKNTLVLKALEQQGWPQPEEILQGPTAIGVLFGGLSQPLKTIRDFAREAEAFSVKGGMLGNSVLSAADVQTLGELPDVETLRAHTLGGLQAPMSSFVGVLDAALRGVLYVLDARAEQLGPAAG